MKTVSFDHFCYHMCNAIICFHKVHMLTYALVYDARQIQTYNISPKLTFKAFLLENDAKVSSYANEQYAN